MESPNKDRCNQIITLSVLMSFIAAVGTVNALIAIATNQLTNWMVAGTLGIGVIWIARTIRNILRTC